MKKIPRTLTSLIYNNAYTRVKFFDLDHNSEFGLFPARIREISRPRLNAWLNINLVWNVDTNGNQENNAMGMKMSIPMPASYSRAIDLMDFHSPIFFINGFHAAAIERIPHPVGTNAKMNANMSVTDKSVNTTAMAIPARANKNKMPWTNRKTS